MTKKPTINNGFDRATLRQAADHLAIGLTDLLHDILRLASLIQSGEGEGNKPEYLELCDREGPGCDCELACKHKPKHLYTEREKAFARAAQQCQRSFRNQSQDRAQASYPPQSSPSRKRRLKP
ncbi:hypothetical protein LHFGNBLO_000126 [Mesorhizobium sp. AR10]|uniref:hypothetical protein n=1 Tax=Mesorhizobium sp. AR10 TaxID=2865839 RepID=UPI00215F3CAE|nr:hypothetical protein [Mesorhizobium sp. AR10]UVK38833.1 hypothetical protein LHFGNBLO_000126 [Mesorhizobium sp. AR10]